MSGPAGKSFDKSQEPQVAAPARHIAGRQAGAGHEAVLALQRAGGNRAVTKLLGGGSGKLLDPATRADMESKFGEDFSEVRVHTGEAASGAALDAGARAFTSGRDIVFGEGFYAPLRSEGRRLIAHELAHVVQQSRAGGKSASRSAVESEARQAGASAAAGQVATVQAGAGGGAQADPMTEDEIQQRIAENEAKVANASPQEADELFKEREALQQQMSAATPAPEAPAPPQPAQVPSAPPAEAPKVQPFDPQAGNPFVKWLLYRNDTPVLDALTNDKNLKTAQDVAMGVTITAGTIATGGLLAEAAAGAGAGAVTAGAIGGAGGSATSVALKSAYKGELPTAKEAITEIGVGALTGGVGGGLGGAATNAGLGKIASGAIGGAGGAATQTLADAAISGKAPTAKAALTDIAKGAAFGAALSKAGSSLESSAAEPSAAPGEAEAPSVEKTGEETQAPPEADAPSAEAPKGLGDVPPDIDEAVEQGIVEEPLATDRPSPLSRPQRPASRGAAAAAREQFGDYRGDYANRLSVAEGGQVHHAVELQALDKYPGVYSEPELNALENMRGIPPELQGRRQLHNSKIREILDRHYRGLDAEIAARQLQPGTPEYNGLVRDWLASGSRQVDWALDPFFSESRAGGASPAAAAPETRVRVATNPQGPESAEADEPPFNFDAPGAQAEIPGPEATEPPQARLRFENGQLVNYDAPRLRVDTTPQRIGFEPEPGDYLDPEEQASEAPLKRMFLRRDRE